MAVRLTPFVSLSREAKDSEEEDMVEHLADERPANTSAVYVVHSRDTALWHSGAERAILVCKDAMTLAKTAGCCIS